MTPVEQVHALWRVFARGGPLASLEHVDADCEWVPPPEVAGGAPVRGTQALRAHVERLMEAGIDFEPALHSCEQVGADVLVAGRMRVITRAALSDSPHFWLCRLRAGRVVRIESYACRTDALSAARA